MVAEWQCRFADIVEPNMQVILETLSHDDLPQRERIVVEYVAFKRDKSFRLKNPAAVEFRLDATKFYKVHCFHENPYFDNPVIAYDIVKNDVPQRQLVIDSSEIERAMKQVLDHPLLRSRQVCEVQHLSSRRFIPL